jgi:hypothetical protein
MIAFSVHQGFVFEVYSFIHLSIYLFIPIEPDWITQLCVAHGCTRTFTKQQWQG